MSGQPQGNPYAAHVRDVLLSRICQLRIHELDRKSGAILDAVIARYRWTSANYEELDHHLRTNQDRLNWRHVVGPTRFAFMPPVERGTWMLPVVGIDYDLRGSLPWASIQLALFAQPNGGDLKAYGMRFESPVGSGLHGYYHAQPVSCLFNDAGLRFHEDWVPESQPAIPLGATNPVALLIAMLVSLYGTVAVSRACANVLKHGRSHVEILPCLYSISIDLQTQVSSQGGFGQVRGTVSGPNPCSIADRVDIAIHGSGGVGWWSGTQWVAAEQVLRGKLNGHEWALEAGGCPNRLAPGDYVIRAVLCGHGGTIAVADRTYKVVS
jgi:hypothetical protein